MPTNALPARSGGHLVLEFEIGLTRGTGVLRGIHDDIMLFGHYRGLVGRFRSSQCARNNDQCAGFRDSVHTTLHVVSADCALSRRRYSIGELISGPVHAPAGGSFKYREFQGTNRV